MRLSRTDITVVRVSRRPVQVAGVVFAVLLGWAAVVFVRGERPIRIGVIHSMTGTMASSEAPLVDAVNLAVREINDSGGVLGRTVQVVAADGKSDPEEFARAAERLIRDSNVVALFGCWTSACRRRVVEVVKAHDHVLFYPVQYEGLEDSTNVVYTGAVPNQQIIPALRWSFGSLGRRVFLVGSDYVFPHAANAIVSDFAARWHGEIVGRAYVPLGGTGAASAAERDAVRHAVQCIASTRPDFIFNTLNGDVNLEFFRRLRDAGIRPDRIPTISVSLAEVELKGLGPELMKGDYAAWSYFQTLDDEVNHDFVGRFRARFGNSSVVDDPIQASYVGVQLWATAVRVAGTTSARAVRKAVKDKSYRAPEGMVYVDSETNHLWKAARIGRIRVDGDFDIIWDSHQPIRPAPYPNSRTRPEWQRFLDSLYEAWGGQWHAPPPPGVLPPASCR